MATRRSYTVSFKLAVVRELAGGDSAQAVADRHGVTSSMVRKWSANRAELEAAQAQSDGGQFKLGCGRKPDHEAVDRALLAWVLQQKADGHSTTEKEMQDKARQLALEQGIADFRASKGYICNFKRRNKLSGPSTSKRRRRSRTVVVGLEANASQEVVASAAVAGVELSPDAEVDVGAEGFALTPEQVPVAEPAAAIVRDCMFGMDLGLKNVKCAVVCATNGSILATSSALVEFDEALEKDERNVDNVLMAVKKAVSEIPIPLRQRTQSLGLCGVMHGILWWRCELVRRAVNELLSQENTTLPPATIGPDRPWSPYITFLDQRCTPARLDEWRSKIQLANTVNGLETAASSPIASGYGLATFAYMMESRPQELARYDTCGTIHDFVGFVLCGHSRPDQNCIDTTDAFSLGGFDINAKTWNIRSVQALGLPVHMLPSVKDPGAVIGHTSDVAQILGLPSGVPVYLPMGDHPCAVMTNIAQTRSPADLNLSRTSVLSIGSASQLAMVLTGKDAEQLKKTPGSSSLSFEVRPFLSENWFLGVAGSLSGGNIFAWFIKQCQEWSRQLIVDPTTEHLTEEAMYAQLIALGRTKLDTDLEFSPTLYGEWAAPTAKGSIEQLKTSNWSLGDISAAICRGLIDNIFSMVPDDLRDDLLRHPMIGTGQALVRNSLLRYFVEQKLMQPTQLSVQNTADAAVGVAFIPLLLQK